MRPRAQQPPGDRGPERRGLQRAPPLFPRCRDGGMRRVRWPLHSDLLAGGSARRALLGRYILFIASTPGADSLAGRSPRVPSSQELESRSYPPWSGMSAWSGWPSAWSGWPAETCRRPSRPRGLRALPPRLPRAVGGRTAQGNSVILKYESTVASNSSTSTTSRKGGKRIKPSDGTSGIRIFYIGCYWICVIARSDSVRRRTETHAHRTDSDIWSD